jgi:hypothetical protein
MNTIIRLNTGLLLVKHSNEIHPELSLTWDNGPADSPAMADGSVRQCHQKKVLLFGEFVVTNRQGRTWKIEFRFIVTCLFILSVASRLRSGAVTPRAAKVLRPELTS